MIARLLHASYHGWLIALAVIGIARPAVAQAPAAPRRTSRRPPQCCWRSRSSILKGVKNVFEPLVRGVVIKTKKMFMQTNFMWPKDLNEVAVIVEKQFEPRVAKSWMRVRASMPATSPSRN